MNKLVAIVFIALIVLPTWAVTIKDIVIVNQTGESYDISSVAAFTSFKVGEEVTDLDAVRTAIAVDVKRMRESGRYSFVSARMDVDGSDVVLVYTVVSKHRLRRVEIRGAEKMGNHKVVKKSELEIGQFADEVTFELAASKIKEAYRDFWYPETKVEWTTKTNDELGTVDVTYRIKEGRKLGIKHIDFEGNNHIAAGKLRKVMQQKEKRWYSFITGTGKYNENLVDTDVFSLKSLYMNEGFLDVQVSDPVLDDSRPGKSRLVFRINEGQQYRIGEIALAGMEEISEEELRRAIRIKPGEIASYKNIEAVSESLRAYYGNRGYIRASVRPVFDADAEKGITNIRYTISEGSIGYINKINITGNDRTMDKVIRRELVVYPGEKYSRSRVKTSESKLRNLNYFEYANIYNERTSESDKYDLNVQVKEKSTGQFMAGVAFSTYESLLGYIELSEGNFSYKTWPPRGAGQKFKIRAQFGTKRNDLDISFVEPWFMDRKLSFGVDLYHREARYYSTAYNQTTDGFRLSLGKPLSRFTRGTLSYSLERFDVFDVDASASPVIRDEEGARTKSGLDYTWMFDSRDNYLIPTRGNKTSLSAYMAGGPLGYQTDIYGIRARSFQYWPLVGHMVFNVRGQVESVEAFGDSKRSDSVYGNGVPLYDRLFIGPPYTLRGFKYRDVGPHDGRDAIGGNSSAYATAELTFPLWSKIRGATFYDWGFVNVGSWDFDPSDYNDNVGIGLRVDVPGLPLQLDYAWPITYDETYQSGKGRINFYIGHLF